MSNNYSVVGFWKGWHCSFNKWLVRYIYVPLGGSKPGRRWNVFVVFAFVSFWHDVEPKLFMWGLLNGVFFMLEALMKELYRRSAALESCRAHPLANRFAVVAFTVILFLFVNSSTACTKYTTLPGGVTRLHQRLIAIFEPFLFRSS